MSNTDLNKTVFISYRRNVSRNLARSIFMDLHANGYDVFMDVESLNAGDFEQIILNQIAARAHFVLLLSDGSLQRNSNKDDWLWIEIQEAMRLNRNIVPIYEEGFNFDKETAYLPDTWRDEFKRLNEMRLFHDYFNEGMVRLRTRFLTQPFAGSVTPTPLKEQKAVEQTISEVIREGEETQAAPAVIEDQPLPFVASPEKQKPQAASPVEDMPLPPPATPEKPKLQAALPAAEKPKPPTTLPEEAPAKPAPKAKQWKLPNLTTLLIPGTDQAPDHDRLLKQARIIEKTLNDFGAPGRVVDVRTGAIITQFGVEPDYVADQDGKKIRVKPGAIAALEKDLQLALGAKKIRIEAPVPGKGYVGIEVPNAKPEIVRLREVLESAEFRRIKSPLAVALGQSIDGTATATNLASAPHLLIAGALGSGKSVLVNAIIASLLLSNTPRTLNFIMLDTKKGVEFSRYNGIPHLVAPVVVELGQIVSVLKWVMRQMDERYSKFGSTAHNIEEYNRHPPANEPPLPYLLVIIDELEELMRFAPEDTERTISRIAALAGATGIHLVIATQRPSADVVTASIKQNFPARIAFAVAGSSDSRIILDQPGGERLLGRGDMLYKSGAAAPTRLQGVFVSDAESSKIVDYWRNQANEADTLGANLRVQYETFGDHDEALEETVSLVGDEDAIYYLAVELVRRFNKASVSMLQANLKIDHARAVKILDMMEVRGIIGPAKGGSAPREVLPSG